MKTPKIFHLKRYFAITSLMAIIAVTVSVAKVAWDLGNANLLERETRTSEEFSRSFTSSIRTVLETFLTTAGKIPISSLAEHANSKKLDREVAHFTRISPVLKLTLFNKEGMAVYSTFTDETGQDIRGHIGFHTALSGGTVSELKFYDAFRLQRDVQLLGRHVYITYMPLRLVQNGPIDTVLALYRDVTPAVIQRKRSFKEIGLSLTSGAAALYLILLLAASRASNILKKAEENIRYHAYHDTLTGLPNRTTFQNRVSQAISRAKRSKMPFGVMFLDLDRFKSINDSLGHDIGDEILKAASRRIQLAVRETDSVYRLGGDEFTVLLENLDAAESAATVARRINTSMSVPTKVGDHEASMMASIGIATYPNDGETVDDLVKAADTAMYSAKDLGGSQFHFYTQEMNRGAQTRWELEAALQRAVLERQFLLHYQPKVACISREVVGIEALLRWQHPTRGILPPIEFLPFLEQSGLIVPVGEYVLREACRQTKCWQDSGVPVFRMSVNISIRQFRGDFFVDLITRILAETGLDAAFLELELTEGVLLDNPRLAIKKMEELKALGVTLSIDDFGSGYSSLSYLKHFPVDYLKVDKSFITDLQIGSKDNAITLAIAGLARSLNLGIVAEGVETAEQVRLLKTHGYNELQGYIIAKPMDPSAIPAFVMTTHTEALSEMILEN